MGGGSEGRWEERRGQGANGSAERPETKRGRWGDITAGTLRAHKVARADGGPCPHSRVAPMVPQFHCPLAAARGRQAEPERNGSTPRSDARREGRSGTTGRKARRMRRGMESHTRMRRRTDAPTPQIAPIRAISSKGTCRRGTGRTRADIAWHEWEGGRRKRERKGKDQPGPTPRARVSPMHEGARADACRAPQSGCGQSRRRSSVDLAGPKRGARQSKTARPPALRREDLDGGRAGAGPEGQPPGSGHEKRRPLQIRSVSNRLSGR